MVGVPAFLSWPDYTGTDLGALEVAAQHDVDCTAKRAIADRGGTASGKDFDALDRRHRQGFQRVAKVDIRNNPAIDKKHGRESAERSNTVDPLNVAAASRAKKMPDIRDSREFELFPVNDVSRPCVICIGRVGISCRKSGQNGQDQDECPEGFQ